MIDWQICTVQKDCNTFRVCYSSFTNEYEARKENQDSDSQSGLRFYTILGTQLPLPFWSEMRSLEAFTRRLLIRPWEIPSQRELSSFHRVPKRDMGESRTGSLLLAVAL